MRHRLEARDAEALAAGRTRDDRRTRVQTLQLVVREKAARPRHAAAERAVTRNDEVEIARRLDELEHALLLREAPRIEHLRRLGLLADLGGKVDAARDHADVLRTERTARRRQARTTPRSPAGHPAERRVRARHAARSSTSVPQTCTT